MVFYLIAQLRHLAGALPVLSRVMLLLEMIGGAIFLAWFIRSTSRVTKDGTSSRKATHAAAWVGLALFAAVFVSNSLGYVGLANYLGAGALAGAYLAILFYAAAGILEGLTFFALHLRPFASLGAVRNHEPLIRRRIARFIYIAAFIVWAPLTLGAFSLRSPVLDWLNAFANADFSIRSLHFSFGALLAFVVTIWFAFLLSRFVRFLLEEDIYDRLHLARGSAYAVTTIVHYIILLIGFYAALTAVGADMTRFAILAGAFGVGIGFGLQNIFNNFISGLILLFERPVQVGDIIEVGGASGTVQRIGIRASIIRLANSSELIVPNGQLISERVGNWTLSNRQRRIELRIGVSHDTDPQRVIDLLTKVTAEHPLVASKPVPEAFMLGFGAETLPFELFFWIDDVDHTARVQSGVAIAVNTALREAKIEIPFPQRDLHLQSLDPAIADALGMRDAAPPSEPPVSNGG